MNKLNSESKRHYKMYKKGKLWIYASILSFTLFTGLISVSAGADDNVDIQQAVSLPINGHFESPDNGITWKYDDSNNQAVKGLYDDNGNVKYFNENDGTQAKGSVVNVNNQNYYFDSDSGNGHKINNASGAYEVAGDGFVYKNQDGSLEKGVQSIDNNIQYFDQNTGIQAKNSVQNIGGQNYYFNVDDGNLTGKVDNVYSDGNYVANGDKYQFRDDNNQPVTGLAYVKNNLQYFDPSTGNQVKNQRVVANGATYYFDDNGNGKYLFTNTSNTDLNDVALKNAVNSQDASSFKNTVDGFLTAETWYRPKEILDNGENWRPSTDQDYRPVITDWWPNKNVEVNYLNLMQNEGLLSNDIKYSVFSDQATLNQATQAAQIEIEKRIKNQNSTEWLNNLLFKDQGNQPSFVKQQYIWNSDSEYPWQGDGWFQGGYLKYGNSPLTPNTNSNYRNPDNVFDFLLANDVDNSNPAVQAEDLNWLHYLMNFGSITANDNDANFDSIRIDAVDFISNDSIQRTYDYLKEAYNLTKNDVNANQHISLVEAGVDAGTTVYNQDALVESTIREEASRSLTNGPGKNASLVNMLQDIDSGVLLADHINNSSNSGVPNYSIIHAHDKGIQENVGAAISDVTGADWTNFTPEQLQAGLKAYYADQRSTDKKYNIYNLPSIYALMLTNKGTVPRIYYGDMFQDDGQYMQNESLYYDAIKSLMLARKSYVSGGQTMSVDHHGLLESVRFGKGASNANDAGNQETRTQGIGLIVGNNPSINIGNDDVVLHMGAAHKNQAYRALMLTTPSGIQTYDSDENSPVLYTNDDGDLIFNNQNNVKIEGTLNPQVSGYLAAWVPVGANKDQDARTNPSSLENTDGKVLHSNDSLDSNLIFEGFSNFQPNPTKHDEMTNVVISKNAKLFSDWGITSFEMAPQYRSSDDHTFLDSTISNGYAFSDRYDLGFRTPTKYGDDGYLRTAIKALHSNGMQVMADVVYNQLYNLPGHEIVSTNRAGVYGNDVDLPFGTQLYMVDTIGGGKYQEQYGGNFLNDLKEKYSDLFKAKTYSYYFKNYASDGSAYLTEKESTRSEIPNDELIKQWSAKYMNGTNILGRGMGYVLKNWNTGNYFDLNNPHFYLPIELLGKTGWKENPDGSWSYYDADSGDRLRGTQVIDGQTVHFNDDGIQTKGGWGENADGSWSYYDADSGDRLRGTQVIDGQTVHFNDDGIQTKGGWGENPDGSWSYYDAGSGDRLRGTQVIDGQTVHFNDDGIQTKGGWGENPDGSWSYYDAGSGDSLRGTQVIDGQTVHFNDDGIQTKGGWGENADGSWSYYDADSGDRLRGTQVIDGQTVHFNDDGIQTKGGWGENPDGSWSYYDAGSGDRLRGTQVIDGQTVHFNDDGIQTKGGWGENPDGSWSYYDAGSGDSLRGTQVIDGQTVHFNDDGIQTKGGWGENADGSWSYYAADSGDRLRGTQVIDGQTVHFNDDGIQTKGGWGENADGSWSYYAADSGDRLRGTQVIDGQTVHFNDDGIQTKGGWGENADGSWSYYDADSGCLVM